MPTAFDASRLEALRGTMTAENFSRLVRLFAADPALRPGLLDEAMRADDRGAVQAVAHAIRGLSGNMGAAALASLAAEMEADCQSIDRAAQTAQFEAMLGQAAAARAALDEMVG